MSFKIDCAACFVVCFECFLIFLKTAEFSYLCVLTATHLWFDWLSINIGGSHAQNHLSCTIPTSGTIAKVIESVVTLMFLVIFNVVACLFQKIYVWCSFCITRKEKKIGYL